MKILSIVFRALSVSAIGLTQMLVAGYADKLQCFHIYLLTFYIKIDNVCKPMVEMAKCFGNLFGNSQHFCFTAQVAQTYTLYF